MTSFRAVWLRSFNRNPGAVRRSVLY